MGCIRVVLSISLSCLLKSSRYGASVLGDTVRIVIRVPSSLYGLGHAFEWSSCAQLLHLLIYLHMHLVVSCLSAHPSLLCLLVHPPYSSSFIYSYYTVSRIYPRALSRSIPSVYTALRLCHTSLSYPYLAVCHQFSAAASTHHHDLKPCTGDAKRELRRRSAPLNHSIFHLLKNDYGFFHLGIIESRMRLFLN